VCGDKSVAGKVYISSAVTVTTSSNVISQGTVDLGACRELLEK